MNVLYVGYRDLNHSSAGGYDKIMHYPEAETLVDKDVPFGSILLNHRGKTLNLFFLDVVARFKRYKFDVTHFIYSDITCTFPYSRSRKHKIVATVHLDLCKRNELHNHLMFDTFLSTLKSMDGVIALSSYQQQELINKYQINAVYIPHGFEIPLYNSINVEMDWGQINVCFSGSNYRDIDTFIKVVSYCFHNRKDIIFHALGQSDLVKSKLSTFSNVKCYPRVSDDEYFSIISKCDYNFLPLTFATANNALLEAEFLGISSILPRIAGVFDYAAPEPLNLFYSDYEELVKIFTNISKKEIDDRIIEYSRRFLWSNVYSQLKAFYESLFVD